MAEKEEEEGGKKKGGGWIKAILGTVGGLCSGAVVMYLSAWVDKAVKPAKPVPNFRVEHEGCTVHLQNLSPGFNGWWDFGDGSELVPANADNDSVTHKYDHPGDYTVKLSLTNLLGEDADRTVALHIDDAPEAQQPKIVSLQAVRVSLGAGAPAAFKVTAKTENAPLCIWDVGDNRPMEVVSDGTASLERVVMFEKPGNYVIKLAAVNDNVVAQATAPVAVQDAPAGSVSVVLTTTDSGTSVKTRTVPCTFSNTFRPDAKGDVCPLSGCELRAASSADRSPDWVIRDVRLTAAGGKQWSLADKTDAPIDAAAMGVQSARNLRLQLSPDRKSVHLTGELVRPAGKTGGPPPSMVLQGEMIEEQRKSMTHAAPMPATLVVPAPGQTTTQAAPLPPVPAEWVDVQTRKIQLAVRDGTSVVAQGVAVPGRTEVTLKGRPCTLVAVVGKDKDNKDQVTLSVTAGK
jgi:PKD repeat protein